MPEFLFEIGLEEVPARMIASAQAELERRTFAMLERERLLAPGAASKSFSTPRRLAVIVSGVLEQQPDLSEEVTGPAIKIAYKDGVPTPAAVAFARKSGVAVEDLRTISTPKGDYLAATSLKPGRDARAVIAAELPKEVAAIYWAKNMYWRPGKPERFVRPVRWLLALLGDEGVPVCFAGFEAVDMTLGHRVLCSEEMITVERAADYEQVLERCFVMADVEKRRHFIRKALDRVCRTAEGMRWREDHALVDKMTHMTEWPSVILGRFDEEFLALPEEVLVTVMRDHQNYFAVEDKSGKLAPYFLAILNTVADEAGEAVIRHGNERVLRARFNDARFFWEFDQRTPLIERLELLKAVTFQKDIGSYFKKTMDVSKVANSIMGIVSQRGVILDSLALEEAVRFAKTDLTCELVKEFTELQGIIGGLYASAQGFSKAAAEAIYDQYRPVSMSDDIPKTVEGSILSIADRIVTIEGMFWNLLQPTGSKDPFALRRAANGIVKILDEGNIPLTLSDLVTAAMAHRELEQVGPVSLGDMDQAAHILLVCRNLSDFFVERLESYLREARNQAYDVVKAVLAVGSDDVRDTVARAEAVTAVRNSEDFTAVSAAFKRMKNILTQAQEKGIAPAPEVSTELMAEPSERDLWQRSNELAARVSTLRAEHSYITALESIATLRPQVDAFFEAVMVMAPDEAVRANRLALLAAVLAGFSGIADFSEIVVAG